ncbi:MAG: OsmC family protein [Lewinellaceae bacterium]|nr:OsmC family protein [Phaeodactylibacter sp.]MCB9039776.1 OsmC family protein [Lewinellaceae bacterium]
MKRTANAVWKGTGKEGKGTLTTQSGAFKEQPYSFRMRFQNEDGKEGTNPEELIAAAHAGCFNMALAVQLSNAGFTPGELKTEAKLHLETVEGAPTITKIELTLVAEVPGIGKEKFMELANGAKANCPVSRVLKAAEITLDATLKA